MVDGKQSAAQLLKKLTAIGLNETSLKELIDLGFIAATAPIESATEHLADDVNATLENHDDLSDAKATEDTLEKTEAEQFELLYSFFNETIKSVLGLRGIPLQLKVERARNIDDLKALRQPYLEAVLKSKGREIARSLRDRLDMLLYESEKARQNSLTRMSMLDFE
ncbi:hypothetical protein ACO0K2_10035 [Undibacterium sp. MH2W]|uniref:hypothetical protein n=1 Tax=Undibacterium sp. MH2W TaxID=3413044 RepID=UPI003BF04A22